MIASLMMYLHPELEAATDRYWACIRQHLAEAGIDSPETLTQEAEEFSVWKHPQLVLSQTCGMPYRTCLSDKVKLVGTPDFGAEDCPAGYYRSAVVVRRDDQRAYPADFKTAIFAYNQPLSQSGLAAAYWHFQPYGFWFQNQLETGAHIKSAQAVAAGKADIAVLDAVSWRIISRYEAFAESLRVLEWTVPTPGHALITAPHNDADAIFTAVERAIHDLPAQDRADLGLRGIVKLPKADYLAVRNPDGVPG